MRTAEFLLLAVVLSTLQIGQVWSFSSLLSCQQNINIFQRGWSANPPSFSFCTRLSVVSLPTQSNSKFDASEDDDSDGDAIAVGNTEEDLDEEMFLDELDGDDEEYEIDLAKKGVWIEELQRLARTTSEDPTAVEKATVIFDDMFEAFVMTEETIMCPGVDVYNLLLEIHAYSRSPEGAVQAEKLLSRMEDPAVELIARPNLETYLKVMDAWAMRKDTAKAEEVLKRIEKRYEETGDEAIQPSVQVYNKLIKAYGMKGEADRAEEIFVSLLDKSRNDPLRANYKSWVQIMKAFASLPNGIDKVQAIFRQMLKEYRSGEEDYKPRTDAYNTLLRALGQQHNGAEEAEAVLFDLLTRYRAGEEDVRPNGDTFRHALTAQRRRMNISGAKVEQLLQIQEGLYATTKQDDLKMDGRLYNVALYAISRSRDSKKAIRARRIWSKMKELDDDNHINVRTYFNVLSACAFTDGTPEEKLEAFQIAVDTLKELRESVSQEPDSSCFGMFLKACGTLMPESRKRDAVIENIFRKCCNDGLVDEFVLSEFEKASSEALQLSVLGGFLDDGVRIPEEWSKHTFSREQI